MTIHEAAERLRRHDHVGDCTMSPYWNSGNGFLNWDRLTDDQAILADAYLSEHDPAPITPQYLEDLGYDDSVSLRYEKWYEICDGVRIVFSAAPYPKCWDVELWIGKERRRKEFTLGQLRTLLRVLRGEA